MNNIKTLIVESIRDNQSKEIKISGVKSIALTCKDNLRIEGVITYENDIVKANSIHNIEDCYLIAIDNQSYKYIILCDSIDIKHGYIRLDTSAIIETTDKYVKSYDYLITNSKCEYSLIVTNDLNYYTAEINGKNVKINNINIDINIDYGKVYIKAKFNNLNELIDNIVVYNNILYYYFDIDANNMWIEYIDINNEYIRDKVDIKKYNIKQIEYDKYHTSFIHKLITSGIIDIQNNYLEDAVILKHLHANIDLRPYMLFNINKLINMTKKVVEKEVINNIRNNLKINGRHELLMYTTIKIDNEPLKIPCVKEIRWLNCNKLNAINYLLEANDIMQSELEKNHVYDVCSYTNLVYTIVYRNKLTHEDNNLTFIDDVYIKLFNNLMVMYNYYIHSADLKERAIIARNYANYIGNRISMNQLFSNRILNFNKNYKVKIFKKDSKYYINFIHNNKQVEIVNKTNVMSLPENKILNVKGYIQYLETGNNTRLIFILNDYSE